MPSTPSRSSSLQSSQHSTPISVSSANQTGSQSRHQEDLLSEMEVELGNSVYQSDSLLDKIFRTHDSVNRIFAQLKEKDFPAKANFPLRGGEPTYYLPFATLLNEITQTMIGLGELDIYKNIEFEVYDKSMAEGTGHDAAIKPDLIARQRPVNTPGNVASWKEVEFCVEVKGNWKQLILQASTYARCIFAFQRNRRFVPVIFFRHTHMEVKIGIFTASWLCITKTGMKIKEDDGLKRFVGEIVRMLACRTRWDAGFDIACNNTFIDIPTGGRYTFSENICNRQSVRGRRTRVDLIEKVRENIKGEKIQPRSRHYNLRNLQTSKRLGPIESRTKIGSRSQHFDSLSTPLENVAEGVANLQIQDEPSLSKPKKKASGNKTPRFGSAGEAARHHKSDLSMLIGVENPGIPADSPLGTPPLETEAMMKAEAFILKDSWPVKSRKTEGEMFCHLSGTFGLPEVLHYYDVSGPNGVLDETDALFPEDAEPYPPLNVFPPRNHESRIHTRIIIGTIGKPLTKASGPRQLLLGVLHAILGHWYLFKGGWLHRDVSIGNVMLMETPVCLPFDKDFDFPNMYLETCTAFITDGDLAIQYDQPDREVGSRRSGTPPFMSCFLLESMLHSTPVLHTALDDLESFAWVLLWAILDVPQVKRGLNNYEIFGILGILHSTSIKELIGKSSLIRTLASTRQLSPLFAPFASILFKWLHYCSNASLELPIERREEISNHLHFFKPYYQHFLQLGFDTLKDLPITWD